MIKRNIGGRCTRCYTKCTDGNMHTDHKYLKAIYFHILNKIIECLVEIFTVCFSKISRKYAFIYNPNGFLLIIRTSSLIL